MTVAELRLILSTYPDEMTVVVEGYEGGFQSPEKLYQIGVSEPDDDASFWEGDRTDGDIPAVVISRSRT